MPSTQGSSALTEGQNDPSPLDGETSLNSLTFTAEFDNRTSGTIATSPPVASGTTQTSSPNIHTQSAAQTGNLAAALQPLSSGLPGEPTGTQSPLSGLPGGATGTQSPLAHLPGGHTGTQSPIPTAAHSLQHLNKLASEQQQTLAGTLGHTAPIGGIAGGLGSHPRGHSLTAGGERHPPSPVVIQPTTDVISNNVTTPVMNMNTGGVTMATQSATSGGVNNSQGQGQNQQCQGQVTSGQVTGHVTAAAQNGQDVQNNNTVKVKSCAGCGARICDRFLLHTMDRYWHTGCLKCSCCQAQLGEIGTTCYAKAGMILCKNDYIRLFGSSGTCSACAQSIPASEFVMRAQTNVYHLNCFTCVACNSRLVPGDRYSLFNGSLICEHDYPKVLKGHTQIPLRPSHKVC